MSAILPFVHIDSASLLARYFTPYQICWIEAEDPFHEAKTQVFAFAEKSVRIGWTFCDGFKNVRKRLRFKNRDYLFASKDWPSALEYMHSVYEFADMLGYTRAVLSHGEDLVKVKALDPAGQPTSLTEEVKIGYIKFENGSRIIAFSSNPYAMAVYGGDVGLDEFAKHPNAKLLWQTAQARVTWAYDLAVWSSHDGEDTLFNQFALQARATAGVAGDQFQASGLDIGVHRPPSTVESPPPMEHATRTTEQAPSTTQPNLKPETCTLQPRPGPWNLYFRVTMPDAVELGLLEVINRTKSTHLTPEQFLADCQARSGSEEVYQQSYLCNPLGAATASIVEWSAIERCRTDYHIDRVHLEADQILRLFGQFDPDSQAARQARIYQFVHSSFPSLFSSSSSSHSPAPRPSSPAPRHSASVSTLPPLARATWPPSTSTRSKARNSGSALSSPAAPKIGTFSGASSFVSWRTFPPSRPLATNPAWAASSVGKPPASSAAVSSRSTSPPKNRISVSPS